MPDYTKMTITDQITTIYDNLFPNNGTPHPHTPITMEEYKQLEDAFWHLHAHSNEKFGFFQLDTNDHKFHIDTEKHNRLNESERDKLYHIIALLTENEEYLLELIKIAAENDEILLTLIQNTYFNTQTTATHLIYRLLTQNRIDIQKQTKQLRLIYNNTNNSHLRHAINERIMIFHSGKAVSLSEHLTYVSKLFHRNTHPSDTSHNTKHTASTAPRAKPALATQYPVKRVPAHLKKDIKHKLLKYMSSRGTVTINNCQKLLFQLSWIRQYVTAKISLTTFIFPFIVLFGTNTELTKKKGQNAASLLTEIGSTNSRVRMIHSVIQSMRFNKEVTNQQWFLLRKTDGDYGKTLNDCLNMLLKDKISIEEIKSHIATTLIPAEWLSENQPNSIIKSLNKINDAHSADIFLNRLKITESEQLKPYKDKTKAFIETFKKIRKHIKPQQRLATRAHNQRTIGM